MPKWMTLLNGVLMRQGISMCIEKDRICGPSTLSFIPLVVIFLLKLVLSKMQSCIEVKLTIIWDSLYKW